jgi:ATP-dependent Clp protease adapter protein ClpS
MPDTTQVPTIDTDTHEALEDFYQVSLHNDDHSAMEHVVHCLMQVFGHPQELAIKIMIEAHARGSAIAEVEAESAARLHRDQLQSFGLSATIEKV